jgi:hypothetical protein
MTGFCCLPTRPMTRLPRLKASPAGCGRHKPNGSSARADRERGPPLGSLSSACRIIRCSTARLSRDLPIAPTSPRSALWTGLNELAFSRGSETSGVTAPGNATSSLLSSTSSRISRPQISKKQRRPPPSSIAQTIARRGLPFTAPGRPRMALCVRWQRRRWVQGGAKPSSYQGGSRRAATHLLPIRRRRPGLFPHASSAECPSGAWIPRLARSKRPSPGSRTLRATWNHRARNVTATGDPRSDHARRNHTIGVGRG